jgi:hypothetical protein
MKLMNLKMKSYLKFQPLLIGKFQFRRKNKNYLKLRNFKKNTNKEFG